MLPLKPSSEVKAPLLSGASLPHAVCEVLSWLEVLENPKQTHLLDQGKWTGRWGTSSTIRQNLSWTTQVWWTFVIVGFLSIKEPFLFETSLCLWESWGWAGPRCLWENQGEGQILFTPYSLLAWQIRRFHQALEFSGSDARMQGPLKQVVAGRGGCFWLSWGWPDNTLPGWELVYVLGLPRLPFSVCFPSLHLQSSNGFRECLHPFNTSLLVRPTTITGTWRKN